MLKSLTCLMAGILLLAAISGCGNENGDEKSSQAQSPKESASVLLSYPSSLSAKSSPSDVAKVLIEALDADDKETLLGLVAVNKGMADIEAIYRKHGRRSNLKPEGAVVMAVAGWQATYAFFEKNQTQVERETINGDTAEVFAAGKSPVGKSCTLKIILLREEGLWKVRPGLESLPQ